MDRNKGAVAVGLLLTIGTVGCGGGGGGGGASAPSIPQSAPTSGTPSFINNTPGLSNLPSPTVNPSVAFSRTSINSGGGATSFKFDEYAFKRAMPNISSDLKTKRNDGNTVFDAKFEATGAGPHLGLGPLFNGQGCKTCHVRDGRGSQPPSGKSATGFLLKLSIQGETAQGNPLPVPNFGDQLQDKATEGRPPEGLVAFSQISVPGLFGDGMAYTLAQPAFLIANPHEPLPAGVLVSGRVAPQLAGMGLIEAIPDATILSYADENDANGDGISGRPNLVWDNLQNRKVLGRFGWKAGQPNLLQQTAAAFRNDMGVTNSLFPTETAMGQRQDDGFFNEPELSDTQLDRVAFYLQTQAVPGRRGVDAPEVLRGEEIFHDIGCAACHVPTMLTGLHSGHRLTAEIAPSVDELEGQGIQPYSDFLLHDMGPGLADNRPEAGANGQEWRTPPLWGVGLFQTTNGHTTYLHDGRARNMTEAVLWHGGEGEAANTRFTQLPAADRAYLLAFLASL